MTDLDGQKGFRILMEHGDDFQKMIKNLKKFKEKLENNPNLMTSRKLFRKFREIRFS